VSEGSTEPVSREAEFRTIVILVVQMAEHASDGGGGRRPTPVIAVEDGEILLEAPIGEGGPQIRRPAVKTRGGHFAIMTALATHGYFRVECAAG
jgi:hypothetical protein